VAHFVDCLDKARRGHPSRRPPCGCA
jgi:hypothetical protein